MRGERTPPRGRLAVGMLKNLGSRLSSGERPPYEMPDHDDLVNLDDPTDDLILEASEKKK